MAAYPWISQNFSSRLASRPALLPPLSCPQPPHHDKAAQVKPLWLCAFFPEMSLEAAGFEVGDAKPFATFEEKGARRLVYAASAAASAAGITRGIPLAQAHALCPALKVQPRNKAVEMERLSRLATWAGWFTPTISLQPPQACLLEISGSLRLFGSLAKLKMALSDGLSAQGTCAHVAITPAPLASLLLASQGQNVELFGQEALRSTLGRLPTNVLPLDADSIRRLISIGVQNLHDLWRLPREGLARRFGPELLDFLDRALGLKADPRRAFHPLPRFTTELELPWEIDDTVTLLEAARCLLARLAKFLREHDAGITCLRLDLYHAHSPPSRLRIGTRHTIRDERHLLSLLEEHLHCLRLSAPVLKLQLATVAIQPFIAESQALFVGQKSARQRSDRDWQQLLDQLQARLGRVAVHGLKPLADHRPERAWDYAEPDRPSSLVVDRMQRPLWLLPVPKPLVSRQGHPWRYGPLSVTKNPERIEGGWWKGQDIRRDYYIATDTDGSRLWIFRDLRGTRAWYLHGLFG
jgi:protein ImuB